MARKGMLSTGFVYRRRITKIAGGGKVDWNDGPTVRRIEKAISSVNKRGAMKLARKARSILRAEAHESGALYRSIRTFESQYESSRIWGRASYAWIIYAGSEKADYAMHIETGRYYRKSTRKRVPPVPYMRRAASATRKWMRGVLASELKRAVA